MTLHARLANPTCWQSFMVLYCSVCELRESNLKKEKFWCLWENSLTHFPCMSLHDFLVSGVI